MRKLFEEFWKNLPQTLWEASSLKSMNDFMNDGSGNIVSDRGMEILETYTNEEIEDMIKNGERDSQGNIIITIEN